MDNLAGYFIRGGFKKACFIDESSLNFAYIRLYGWAKSNQRVCEGLVGVRFLRQSILSMIWLDGV